MTLVMNARVQRLLDQAYLLLPVERAELAQALIESIEGKREPEMAHAWEAELDRRQSDLDSGRVLAVPWEQAWRQMFSDEPPPDPA
jgi:putative addiction module component (TIGR02574 family)